MAVRYVFCSQPRLAREPITVAYGTSRTEAPIMRSLGFGWGIQVLGQAHSHSWGRGAELSSDHDVLVILIIRLVVPLWCSHIDPACGSSPGWLPVAQIRGICNYIPSWGFNLPLIASTIHPQLTVAPYINHALMELLVGTFITKSAQRTRVASSHLDDV